MVPGQETGWHRHDVPLYARVLGGELEVDYGGGTVKRYRAGETTSFATKTTTHARSAVG